MDTEKQDNSKKSKEELIKNEAELAAPAQDEAGHGASESAAPEEGEIIEGSSLQEDLAKAQAEAADYKDRHLRLVAEADNMRKRHDKERSELLKYGSEKIVGDLLPVLDSFEKALQSEPDQSADDSSYIEGMRMVHRQLLGVLEKHGVKAFDSKGSKFDPNIHQAIRRVEADVAEDTVDEEYQKGYKLNDRLIRPAVVSVAVPGEQADKDS